MTPNVTTDERSTVYGARVLTDERGREHRYHAVDEQMTVLDESGRVGGQHVPSSALTDYVDAVRERDGIAELYVTDADGWTAIAEDLAEVAVANAERHEREEAA
jgi:hypothetical protein